MVRALLWKEWRRLRGLRWACVGMAAALPAALFLAAHAAHRGWGLRSLAGASSQSLLLEIVPAALALGLWPLAALMMTVHAFTADRAEGTEAFLLDRPVHPARTWGARLAASLASVLVVVLAGAGMILAFLATEGGWGRMGWRTAAIAVAGILLVGAAVLAALGAASLVSAPLPALLLALLFASFPLLAGAGGTVVFPHAAWNRIPLAALAACVLGLGLPLSSWVADTRGEPGGRGRRLRAGLVLGAGLALSAAAFVVLAPLAVRAQARNGRFEVAAPSGGASTFAYREKGGGFVIDLATGEERSFLPPEIAQAAWDPAGERLAVVDESGPLGSVGMPRVRFLDREGREFRPAMRQPDEEGVRDLAWAGDRLVVLRAAVTDPGNLVHHLVVLDPGSGRETRVLGNIPAAALHPLPDGRIFLATAQALPRGAARDRTFAHPWMLRPVDAAAGTLGPPVFEAQGPGYFFPGLSPSGRFWLHVRGEEEASVIEIATGRTLALPAESRIVPRWLAGDELVWLERKGSGAWDLVRWRPGEPARAVAWGVTRNARLLVSPDASLALVLIPDMGLVGATLVDLEGGALLPLPSVQRTRVAWAGPRTLSLSRPGRLALYDVVTRETKVVLGDR